MIKLIEPGFDEISYDMSQAFFDGKPGLDVETKVTLRALFSELRATDYCGDLPSSDPLEGYWYD